MICFTPVKGFIPTSWGFTHTHQVLGVAHMVQVLGLSLNTESPTSRLQTGTSCQICGGIRLKIKDTINEMHLNQPQTIPPSPVHGKIVFHKTGPWCQQGGGPFPWRIVLGAEDSGMWTIGRDPSWLRRVPRLPSCFRPPQSPFSL